MRSSLKTSRPCTMAQITSSPWVAPPSKISWAIYTRLKPTHRNGVNLVGFCRRHVALSAFIAFTCLPALAEASTTSGYGYISGINAANNGAVLFTVTVNGSTRSSIPSCAATFPARWAIDASTVPGQIAAQILMTAFQQHRPISVTGTGSCTIWSNTETVSYIALADF